MAIFRKVIVRPGVFHTDTPKGKRIQAITADRIKNICATAKEMIKDGLLIPAPFAHKDKNKIVPSPVIMDNGVEVDAITKEQKLWSSDINAGFWNDFEVDEKNQLVGYLEIPDENASKIGKTIRQTSVFLEPEFTDGSGKLRKNALRHVAIVNNAVEHGQENFQLAGTEYPLAMSFSMADEVVSQDQDTFENTDKPEGEDTPEGTTTDKSSSCEANIPELVSLIKDKLGYEMPSDTDVSNFIDRLRTILVSIQQDEQENEESLTKKPEKAKTEASPVIMSDEVENQDNVVLVTKKANKLLESLLENMRNSFRAQVQNLMAKGKIGKKYAEMNLYPAIESFAMSLEDFDEEGNHEKTAFEMSLDMLESAPGINDQVDSLNGEIENQDDDLTKASQDELDRVYSLIMN